MKKWIHAQFSENKKLEVEKLTTLIQVLWWQGRKKIGPVSSDHELRKGVHSKLTKARLTKRIFIIYSKHNVLDFTKEKRKFRLIVFWDEHTGEYS